MKHKVSELEGALLDAAVAKALGDPRILKWLDAPWITIPSLSGGVFNPSTDWRDGGPIIERERIMLWPWDAHGERGWFACYEPGVSDEYMDICSENGSKMQDGSTPLVAAMRAYVASKFGEEADL